MPENISDAKGKLEQAEKELNKSAEDLNNCIGRGMGGSAVLAGIGLLLKGNPYTGLASLFTGLVTSDKLCDSYRDELNNADKKLGELHKKYDDMIDEEEHKEKIRKGHMLYRDEYIKTLYEEEKRLKGLKNKHDGINKEMWELRKYLYPEAVWAYKESYPQKDIDRIKNNFKDNLDQAIKKIKVH